MNNEQWTIKQRTINNEQWTINDEKSVTNKVQWSMSNESWQLINHQ